MNNFDFPYKSSFNSWLINTKMLSPDTANRISMITNHFWNFYIHNTEHSPEIKLINESDMRTYFNFLEVQEKLKLSTVNKYLSYLRHYLKFLYTHKLISEYPLLNIKGRKFSRDHIYTIDWMSQIPNIYKLDCIHGDTVKLLICISVGFRPDEILNLKAGQVLSRIHDTQLKYCFEKCINSENFENFSDAYVFQNQKQKPYQAESSFQRVIKDDRKLLGMSLSFSELRRSLIYSILAKGDKTDIELMQLLKLNAKSLTQYRNNLLYYVKLEQFVLPKSENVLC